MLDGVEERSTLRRSARHGIVITAWHRVLLVRRPTALRDTFRISKRKKLDHIVTSWIEYEVESEIYNPVMRRAMARLGSSL
jgi:hypothetical protein